MVAGRSVFVRGITHSPVVLAFLVIIVFGSTTRSARAQPQEGPWPSSSCAWHDQAVAEQQRVGNELESVQAELSRYPVKAATLSLVISGVLVVGGTVLAATYKDDEYHRVPALWAIPGVAAGGVIASGIALGIRGRQRRPFKLQRNQLLQQKARLEFQLETFAREGCTDLVAAQRKAASRLTEVDRQLALIEARARTVSYVGPLVLLVGGGAGFAGSLIAAIVPGISAGEDPDADRGMRIAFGISGAFAAVTISGAAWLIARSRKRRAITSSGMELRREKRSLEHGLTPQLGPSSVGLSWAARF
ncbi:MAG TPA: hypothetical protein VJU61_09900 [Polyangiaceae bacterium]|nr:hypothetical protein [Polyangiaceae bacterium]